jgi:hypothetical protein
MMYKSLRGSSEPCVRVRGSTEEGIGRKGSGRLAAFQSIG